MSEIRSVISLICDMIKFKAEYEEKMKHLPAVAAESWSTYQHMEVWDQFCIPQVDPRHNPLNT